MKHIKITKIEDIKKEVAKVEGRSTSFCFYPSRIEPAVFHAEHVLQKLRIPKRFWNGCYIILRPPQPPNAYNWRAYGTYVTLSRKSKDWFVTSITRSSNPCTSYGRESRETLYLTENQTQHIPTFYEL